MSVLTEIHVCVSPVLYSRMTKWRLCLCQLESGCHCTTSEYSETLNASSWVWGRRCGRPTVPTGTCTHRHAARSKEPLMCACCRLRTQSEVKGHSVKFYLREVVSLTVQQNQWGCSGSPRSVGHTDHLLGLYGRWWATGVKILSSVF